MRLYGHLAWAGELPGPSLCGKPNRRASKPALLVCGRCVRVAVEASQAAAKVRRTFHVNGGAS